MFGFPRQSRDSRTTLLYLPAHAQKKVPSVALCIYQVYQKFCFKETLTEELLQAKLSTGISTFIMLNLQTLSPYPTDLKTRAG